jgi:uncharacterized protein (TIGR04255 family)
MSTKYKNPPINELVIGVYFDRDVASLRSEYVGVFWDRLRDNFPIISEVPLLTRPINLFVDLPLVEFSNMPRYWLESADGTTLIQIQRNAFLMNWRRRNTEYPHYDSVKALFDMMFLKFVAFLNEELHEPPPRIQLTELNYTNVIEPSEFWSSWPDTAKVLPRFSLAVPTNDDSSLTDFLQVTVEKFAPDLALQTTVRSGREVKDLTKPLLIFELRAVGLITEAEDTNPWFRRAHELTGRRFTEMTNPGIQATYWQPR